MTTVLIPTALQRFVGNRDTFAMTGGTVGEVLTDLTRQHGELKKHLYNDRGELRSFVNIFVNHEDIRHQQGLQTAIGEHDVITIVPSIAGGS